MKNETTTHSGGAITLDGRLGNRCQSTFNRSQLEIMGGENSGQILKARHLLHDLTDATLPNLDPAERAQFNAALPKTYQAVLGMANPSTLSYVNGIGGNDYSNIPRIGINLASSADSSPVTRVVFGATEEMPARSLSYLLPALSYVENFKKHDVREPQLQVIIANNISTQLNGLDLSQTTAQMDLFIQTASSYIKAFFPAVADSVVFLKDKPLEKGSQIRDELINIARSLHETCEDEAKEKMKQKATNHTKLRSHLLYSAAHILLHDADIDGVLESAAPDQPPVSRADAIISFGGSQELDFYKIRHSLKPHLEAKYQTVDTLQFFTKHRVPPYHMAQGGDYNLAAMINGDKPEAIAPTAIYDLKYLQAISSTRGSLQDFIQEQRRLS